MASRNDNEKGEYRMNFADAMTTEMSHTKTWNGADALSTTGSRCLDFFGRIGAMRSGDKFEKLDLFDAAYAVYDSKSKTFTDMAKEMHLTRFSHISQRLTKNL